ncbi:MAG TPA: hypothetical protein VFQ53_16855 [Kofleriaceae bacterium]|nr:hypothetical protein [Kofleriaceae bacterium]
MAAAYSTYVLAQRGRWRVELPGAIAILAAITFVFTIGRTIRDVIPMLPWLALAVAIAFAYLAWRAHGRARCQLVVDATGVRIASAAGTRELGIPRATDHGRVGLRVLRNAPPRNHVLWVTVTAADGEVYLFVRPTGALDNLATDWPERDPPRSARMYTGNGLDPVALRAAIAELKAA